MFFYPFRNRLSAEACYCGLAERRGNSVVMDHFPVPKGCHSFSVVETGFKFAGHREGGQQPGCSSQRNGHTQLQGSKVLTLSQRKTQTISPCSGCATKVALVLYRCGDTGSSTKAFPFPFSLPNLLLSQTTTYSGSALKSALFHSSNPRICVTLRTF